MQFLDNRTPVYSISFDHAKGLRWERPARRTDGTGFAPPPLLYGFVHAYRFTRCPLTIMQARTPSGGASHPQSTGDVPDTLTEEHVRLKWSTASTAVRMHFD